MGNDVTMCVCVVSNEKKFNIFAHRHEKCTTIEREREDENEEDKRMMMTKNEKEKTNHKRNKYPVSVDVYMCEQEDGVDMDQKKSCLSFLLVC
jgi:hypothetical protein